jgi:hypothetical protein
VPSHVSHFTESETPVVCGCRPPSISGARGGIWHYPVLSRSDSGRDAGPPGVSAIRGLSG